MSKFFWIIIFFISIVSVYVPQLKIYEDIFQFEELKINFLIKHLVKKNEVLNSRIKIISYDDATFRYLNGENLSIKSWGSLISLFQNVGVNSIYIDKVFSEIGKINDEDINFFCNQIINKVPVYTGASFFSAAKKNVVSVDIRNYIKNSSFYHINDDNLIKGYVYGMNKKIKNCFSGVGIIDYSEANGLIKLAVKSAETDIIPHLSLLTADKITSNKNIMVINNTLVNLTDKVQTIINFLPLLKYYDIKNHYSMMTYLKIIDNNKQNVKISSLNKNDIVIILPLMYTGNVDFKNTPIGNVPGGFINVALVNSVLNNQWISYFQYNKYLSVILLIIGIISTQLLSKKLKIINIIFGSLVIPFLSIFLFIQYDILVNWLFPIIIWCMVVFLMYIKYTLNQQFLYERIGATLQGLVSHTVLEKIIESPTCLNFEPKEVELTVVFIDMVNFSFNADKKSPQIIFKELKQELNYIIDIIHKYGGIIDKTLGDGIMCYFGYNYINNEGNNEVNIYKNMLQAIECTKQIQLYNAKKISEIQTTNIETIFPLRIGINLGKVYIGNLGDEKRYDITLIGDNVNFAKRLETACESFKIIVGKSIADYLILNNHYIKNLEKKFLNIKHKSELVEAYEFNPYIDNEKIFELAIKNSRHLLGIERQKERHLLDNNLIYFLINEKEFAQIIDFSLDGFCIECSTYFAKSVRINLEFSINIDRENNYFNNNYDLISIIAEVRWGTPINNKFKLGISICNLNSEQRFRLFNILKNNLILNK